VSDGNGNTPLHSAVHSKDLNVVKKFVALGCDINSQNNKGYTALHMAADKGDQNMVKWLIIAKANAQLETTDRDKAIDRAYIKNHATVVEMLKQVSQLRDDIENRVKLYEKMEFERSNPSSRPKGSGPKPRPKPRGAEIWLGNESGEAPATDAEDYVFMENPAPRIRPKAQHANDDRNYAVVMENAQHITPKAQQQAEVRNYAAVVETTQHIKPSYQGQTRQSVQIDDTFHHPVYNASTSDEMHPPASPKRQMNSPDYPRVQTNAPDSPKTKFYRQHSGASNQYQPASLTAAIQQDSKKKGKGLLDKLFGRRQKNNKSIDKCE
jgi:hypothetical protein